MKTLNRILGVMTKNLGYTIILLISIALFAIFSDGLLWGLITAASALIAYVCIDLLYKEYKKTATKKKKK
jgi:uncharacterized membrane protein YjfL (UPF0719 family)